MGIHVLVGLLGTACYVIAYALVQLKKLRMDANSYAYLNISGCLCSLYSLSHDFNLAAFVSQAFWLLFTLVGMRANRRALS
ncbi:cyclic nucleotide-binding protein [Vogesella facilis]|uniref:Cyclic nucleotide-binding protein n=1 Tax=Vogesella facilis TaxID=1655232 RepID=A0ABV7R9B6_9NEIS